MLMESQLEYWSVWKSALPFYKIRFLSCVKKASVKQVFAITWWSATESTKDWFTFTNTCWEYCPRKIHWMDHHPGGSKVKWFSNHFWDWLHNSKVPERRLLGVSELGRLFCSHKATINLKWIVCYKWGHYGLALKIFTPVRLSSIGQMISTTYLISWVIIVVLHSWLWI